ncbi:MAG: carotenoid biosynthesis protein [Anaerolineales bacterium]
MPNIYFILFEVIIYIQFLICFRHAIKNGPVNISKLLVGIVFGVMLELATIRQLHAYQYGRFMVMVFDVPLCIGVAWGCIIYSVMEFTDASSLPYWLRPILDGLLALNIDLALDTVAIRLGFWDWGIGLQKQYFGVPYANFWAWFWVIFFFSLGYRIFARKNDWTGKWLPAPTALIIGLIGVLGTNAFITFTVPATIRPAVIAITLITMLAIVTFKRPVFHVHPVNPLAFWVPFLSHAYLLIAGIFSGVIFNPIFILIISIVMIVIAFLLHKDAIPFRKQAQQ